MEEFKCPLCGDRNGEVVTTTQTLKHCVPMIVNGKLVNKKTNVTMYGIKCGNGHSYFHKIEEV